MIRARHVVNVSHNADQARAGESSSRQDSTDNANRGQLIAEDSGQKRKSLTEPVNQARPAGQLAS